MESLTKYVLRRKSVLIMGAVAMTCILNSSRAGSLALRLDDRSASVSAQAYDGGGTVSDTRHASASYGTPFDTSLHLLVESPQGGPSSETWASQLSTVEFPDPGRIALSGVLAASTVSIMTPPSNLEMAFGTFADPISSLRIDFETDLPVEYDLSLTIWTRGDSHAAFNAFEFSQFSGVFGGSNGTWSYRGVAEPGLHSIYAQVHAPSDLLTGMSGAYAEFTLTAATVPLPSALVPGLALLLALTFRRRRVAS